MFCLMSRDSCEKLVTINTYPFISSSLCQEIRVSIATLKVTITFSNSESNNNHIQKPWENSYSYHVPLVEFLFLLKNILFSNSG